MLHDFPARAHDGLKLLTDFLMLLYVSSLIVLKDSAVYLHDVLKLLNDFLMLLYVSSLILL